MLFRSKRYKNLNFLYHEYQWWWWSSFEITERDKGASKKAQMKGFKCLWLVFYEWLSHGNSHLIEHGWVKWWGEREGDGWCFDKSLHTPCSKISISRRGVQKSWGNAVFCPWLTSSYCKIYKYTTGAQMSSRPASITSHWMWAQPETHDSFYFFFVCWCCLVEILWKF